MGYNEYTQKVKISVSDCEHNYCFHDNDLF